MIISTNEVSPHFSLRYSRDSDCYKVLTSALSQTARNAVSMDVKTTNT